MKQKYNCNFIIIEDDLQIGLGLKNHFEENIKIFRDSITFECEIDKDIIWKGLNKELPLIIVLDIMMAEDLDEDQPYAPVWTEPHSTPQKPGKYVNYELGLKIGERIRKGHFLSIDKNVPLLFISARQNTEIINKIEGLKNTWLIKKPFWFEEVDKIIGEILRTQTKY